MKRPNFVRRYLRFLTQQHFGVDDSGYIVFHPYGLWSTGYRIQHGATKRRLESLMARSYAIQWSLIVVATMGLSAVRPRIFIDSPLILLGFACVGGGTAFVLLRMMLADELRGLTRVPGRLRIPQLIDRAVGRMSMRSVRNYVAFSGSFVAISLAMLLDPAASRISVAVSAIFFGGCLAFGIRVWQLKRTRSSVF